MNSVLPRGSEPPVPPVCLVQCLDLHQLGVDDALAHQLGHAIPRLHLKVFGAVVEEDDAHVAGVVGVHNASANVDEVLGGKARP